MRRTCLGVLLLGLWLSAGQALAATTFYVDPDWAGSRQGTAAQPWSSLGDSGAWTAIDNALASGDVTVYFSAREADSDTNERTSTPLQVQRTSTSAYRLTLDGESKYNANDASPSWAAYSGPSRFQISAGMAIQANDTKRSYTTVRGFRLVSGGTHGLYWYGGDHVVIEDIDLTGEGLYFHYAFHHTWAGAGTSRDLTVRNCEIHDCVGEGIYIGGAENENGVAGHDQILIENNHVYRCGSGGGEGDGIDMKDGNTNVVIRGNLVHDNPKRGIVLMSASTVEKNRCYNNGSEGISYSNYWGTRAHDGCAIRNNVLYNNGNGSTGYQGSNITVGHGPSGEFRGDAANITNVSVCNNTCYQGKSRNIYFTGASSMSNVSIRNNIAYGSSSNISVSGTPAGTYLNDHNHTADPLAVSAAGGDFHLGAASPCRDAGVTLSGFADDYEGNARPQGALWDIGAYEYLTAPAPTPPPAPSGLKAVPE